MTVFDDIANKIDSDLRGPTIPGVPASVALPPDKVNMRAILKAMLIAMAGGGVTPPDWALRLGIIEAKIDDVEGMVEDILDDLAATMIVPFVDEAAGHAANALDAADAAEGFRDDAQEILDDFNAAPKWSAGFEAPTAEHTSTFHLDMRDTGSIWVKVDGVWTLPYFALAGARPEMQDRLMGEDFVVPISPKYLSPTYAEEKRPTGRIQKGWGGAYYWSYPLGDAGLFTAPDGGGDAINDAWAGADVLLYEPAYQIPGSTTLMAPIGANTRLVLDVSVPSSPRMCGLTMVDQDPNQHATQRGYPIPGVTWKTNDHPLSMLAVYEPAAGSEQINTVQDTVNGTTRIWRQESGPNRHYPNTDIIVGTHAVADLLPRIDTLHARDDGLGLADDYTQVAGEGGIASEGSLFSTTGTTTSLRFAGPSLSAKGAYYAFLLGTVNTPRSAWRFSGIPGRMAGLFADRLTTKPAIVFPYPNAVCKMDLDTEEGPIFIKGFALRNQPIMAKWGAGAWTDVGTANEHGLVDLMLPDQAKGSELLSIRYGEDGVVVTIANVGVGYRLGVLGDSIVGQAYGDLVPFDIPLGMVRMLRANWTAETKHSFRPFVQKVWDTWECPIEVYLIQDGSTFITNNVGVNGQWSATPAVGPASMSRAKATLETAQLEFNGLHALLFSAGTNDAGQNAAKATWKTKAALAVDSLQALFGENLPIYWLSVGENFGATAAWTDTIREAIEEFVAERPDVYLGGVFHDLEFDHDGVHLGTLANKEAYWLRVFRFIHGNGPPAIGASAAQTATDKVTVTASGGTLNWDNGAGDPTGWFIDDGGAAMTVIGVTISGNGSTWVIQASRNVGAAGTVAFGKGATSQGTADNDNDALAPCPLRAFAKAWA